MADLMSFVQTQLAGKDFEARREVLQGAPYHLRVRRDGELYNVMFTDATPRDPAWLTQATGAVLEVDGDRLVSYTLDRAVEVLVDPSQTETAPELAALALEQCRVARYVEGVKLSVYFSGGWRVSTTRVIDAGKAFWGGRRSFREQLLEALEGDHPGIAAQIGGAGEGPLDPALCYVLVLSAPENKFVAPVDRASVLHIATFDPAACRYVETDVGVPSPEALAFASWQDLTTSLEGAAFWEAGYTVAAPGGRRFKVLSALYARVKAMRGDTPDVQRHMLDLRARGGDALTEFLQFYPEHATAAAGLEAKLAHAAREVHGLYVRYFILHEPRPQLDKALYVTLMQLHASYRETRQRRTFVKVLELIETLPPGVQRQLLRLTGA